MTAHRLHITKIVVRDLKSVSKLSSKNRWEYGGKVKYDKCMNYKGLTYVTSKERARVDCECSRGRVDRRTCGISHTPITPASDSR